jgi:quercetin dioxygenase-like cupin family protein
MSSSQLSAPRLVVTTHTKDGTSVFESDTQTNLFSPFGPQASSFARFHSRLRVPVSNVTSPPDLSNTLPRCPPGGVLFCTTDIPPGFAVPMHRTVSLDYIAVISGEIVLRLDGGDEKTVKAGEFIVQKGVNHQWINRANEHCRVMVVMVGSEKVVLEDGTVLEETVIKKP